jgi:AraC family transcriptional regulator
MRARPCNISAEVDLDGVNIRVLDYRWDAKDEISDFQNSFILRYRSYPLRVGLAAHLNDGRIQDFGQLMFFPARTVVETTPAKLTESTRNVTCTFANEWLRRIWPGPGEWAANDLARCYDMRNLRIERAMKRLGIEMADPGFASNLLIESLVQQIGVEIARHFTPAQRSRRVRTFGGRLSTSQLSRVYEVIDSVSGRFPTSEEISAECGISAAHLRRSFKQTTGLTLHEYSTNARLNKAQTLLTETDLPLKEVAYRLGFSGSCTFSSTFKKAVGESPSFYRRRVQGAI